MRGEEEVVDGDLLGRIFSVQAAAWVATCALIVHLFRARNERLRDAATEKAAAAVLAASEKAGDWERIRDERDRLRARLDVCEKESATLLKRAITAEAQLLGIGMGRQQIAEVEAAKRLKNNGET